MNNPRKILFACASIFLANNIYAEEAKIEKRPNEYFLYEKTQMVLDLACAENAFSPIYEAIKNKNGAKIEGFLVNNQSAKIKKILSSKSAIIYVKDGVAYIRDGDANSDFLVSYGFFKKPKHEQSWNLWVLYNGKSPKISTCFKKEIKVSESTVVQEVVESPQKKDESIIEKKALIQSKNKEEKQDLKSSLPFNNVDPTSTVKDKKVKEENTISIGKAINLLEDKRKKQDVEEKSKIIEIEKSKLDGILSKKTINQEPIKTIIKESVKSEESKPNDTSGQFVSKNPPPPSISKFAENNNVISKDDAIGSSVAKKAEAPKKELEDKPKSPSVDKNVLIVIEKSENEVPLLKQVAIKKDVSQEHVKKVAIPHKISPEVRACVLKETDKMILKKYPNYEIPNVAENIEFKEFMDASLMESIVICHKKK